MSARNLTSPGEQRLQDQTLITHRGEDDWPPWGSAQFVLSAKLVQ